MKRALLITLTLQLTLLGTFSHAQYAFVEQSLANKLALAGDEEMMPVLLLLSDAVDMAALKSAMEADGLPVTRRPKMVMQALKAKANATQPAIIDFLENYEGDFHGLKQFWISNSISLMANKACIEALASLSEVAYMALDAPALGLIAPVKGEVQPRAKSEGGIEPGLAVIGAPELWAMGYTGNGRMALTFDTGVWPDHPSYAQRFLANMIPLDHAWFGYDSPVPVDKQSSHGTHVTGTMLGLDPATSDTIGVAPGAYFIATDPVVSNLAFVKPLTDFMFGYQWSLNPDGDEDTSSDVPDVINNSWGFGQSLDEAPCPPFVVPVFDALEAAGIANVNSAGNEGPDASTIGVPHNINTGLVNSFTVGAINGNIEGTDYLIAGFSSRGPSLCGGEGSLLIKPEVSAPGVNVRSAVGHDAYDTYSGTSMAGPHASGAVLLLKEAFPFLSGEELLLALYYSATDLGEPGEDNTYGMGLINVKDAFDYLSLSHDPVPPISPDIDLRLVSVEVPVEEFNCTALSNASVAANLIIENTGNETVSTFLLEYSINGGPYLQEAINDANLQPGATMTWNSPPLSVGPGAQELHVRIAALVNEYNVFNNNGVYRWQQLGNYPEEVNGITEDFESGFDFWNVLNPDNSITWDTAYVVQSDGEMGYAARMNFAVYSPTANQRDHLVSNTLWNVEGEMTLEFDYYYRRTLSSVTRDTLAIYAMSNCGNFSHELWRKGGLELATNSTSGLDSYPETAEEWSAVSVNFDLSTLPEVVLAEGFNLRFTGINRRGNNLLIDNIMLASSLISRTRDESEIKISLFPNPTSSDVQVRWNGAGTPGDVAVYDLSGKMILQKSQMSPGSFLDVQELSRGMYLVEVSLPLQGRYVAKMVKN